jgi:hypothetical protein
MWVFLSSNRPVLQGDETASAKCPHCGRLPTDKPNADKEDLLSMAEVFNGLQRSFRQYVNPMEVAKEIGPLLTVSNLVNAGRYMGIISLKFVE